MKILLVKSIFCPNKEYLITSIKSLIKTNIYIQLLNKYDIQFDLLLIGWAHIYINHINTILKTVTLNFTKIFTELWVINYGKYKILNYVMDFVKDNDDYINVIFLDHDIHFDLLTIEHFYNIILLNTTINSKEIGLIAFNQKGDTRHQPNIYENSHIINNLNIIWANDNTSIASGAFLILTKTFKLLKHFELKTVYGLDDYFLCKELYDNNFINVVISNCYVIHPYDNNDNFKKWKKNNIIRLINNDNIDYYANIEETINLFYT